MLLRFSSSCTRIGGANNVAGDKRPGGNELQRQLGQGDAALLCQGVIGFRCRGRLRVGVAGEMLEQGQSRLFRPLVVAVFAGQHAKRQRGIGQQAHVFTMAHFGKADFIAAIKQGIRILDADRARQADFRFVDKGHQSP